MSVSLCTQTGLHHHTIQVLNIRVCFLNILYASLTSIHSNLEHGLAILTESFSIGRSKGSPGMCTPLGIQILSFSCSFWQKNYKIIPIWKLAYPWGKSWIHHCLVHSNLNYTTSLVEVQIRSAATSHTIPFLSCTLS